MKAAHFRYMESGTEAEEPAGGQDGGLPVPEKPDGVLVQETVVYHQESILATHRLPQAKNNVVKLRTQVVCKI
jgi:hypothetical protein